jgi:hypothetical protein
MGLLLDQKLIHMFSWINSVICILYKLYPSVMLPYVSKYIYFPQPNFYIESLSVNYLLHVSAFRPTSYVHIHSAASSESAYPMMTERPTRAIRD